MGRTSGRFVGRDTELSQLGDAVASARVRTPTVVVIEGEAGIGKSRLVTEALGLHSDPADLVAFGHGVELAGGELPYGCASDALRSLVRAAGTDIVREAAGAYAGDLAVLCPPLGEAPRDTDRGRLLPAYVSTLEVLADDRLVWLIVEDLHWSDGSSRDLLSYLVRVADSCHLLTVFTLRTDEPVPSPDAEDLVAKLASLERTTRIALPPLTDGDIATLVADLGASGTPENQVARATRLAGGNPLLVEQLVAAGLGDSGPAPAAVVAPMAARVRALDDGGRRLVQLAALTDGDLPHRMLEQVLQVTGGDYDAESAIDSAVAAGILTFSSSTRRYSFTHALLRQAAADTMPPGERFAGHELWARLLSAGENPQDPRSAVATAHHWFLADRHVEAFTSALEAAAQTTRLGALPETATLLRRALDLWDRIPDAAERAGRTRDALLLDTASALEASGDLVAARIVLDAELRRAAAPWSGQRRLCLKLARSSVDQLLRRPLDEQLYAEAGDHVDELLAADSDELVFAALKDLGYQLKDSMPEESLRILRRALAVAQELGDAERLQIATNAVAVLMASRGEVEEALAMCRDLLPRLRDTLTAASMEADCGGFWYRLGRFRDAAAAFERALALVPNPALAPSLWVWIQTRLVDALLAVGDWDSAETVVAETLLVEQPNHDLALFTAAVAGELAAHRGDLEAAERHAQSIRDHLPDDEDRYWLSGRAERRHLDAAVAVLRGNLQGARETLATLWAEPQLESKAFLWPPLMLAARIEGDLARTEPSDAVCQAVELLTRHGDFCAARYLHATADLSRARGGDDPVSWARVADAWRLLGHSHYLGWASVRLAAAAIGAGDADAARPALGEAWQIADRLRAEPLRDAVVSLARRAHIALAIDAADSIARRPASGRLSRLTVRETEVLRHVAQGASNEELAAALFISPRTASVHVSRILAKLEVTSRAKATVVAYEEGLFADQG